jgi:glycosyltransferase involved in cell wall biosynthesis
VLAYSDRVAAWVGGTAVPIAVPVPELPLPLVDEPVAAVVADWRWAPNAAALGTLLALWPQVRRAVPAARLLVAGRGSAQVGTVAGVQVLGEVSRLVDVLSRTAVLGFPCPPTSGPKVKVLEAAAHGVCVVTTAAGAEGVGTDALVVSDAAGFAAALIAVLRDPGVRADRARQARVDVAAVHAPRPAARARQAALERAQRP